MKTEMTFEEYTKYLEENPTEEMIKDRERLAISEPIFKSFLDTNPPASSVFQYIENNKTTLYASDFVINVLYGQEYGYSLKDQPGFEDLVDFLLHYNI